MEELKNLEQDEISLIYSAPVLVAILVAGADGKIDKSEIREAVSISNVKKFKARKQLQDYYKEVGTDFEDKLMVGINQFPQDATERQRLITEQLSNLNPVLAKLETKFAVEFCASLRDFAKRIAEASGGILGYMSIGYEESKIIELRMIKDQGSN